VLDREGALAIGLDLELLLASKCRGGFGTPTPTF
jgi:hypothetical protein